MLKYLLPGLSAVNDALLTLAGAFREINANLRQNVALDAPPTPALPSADAAEDEPAAKPKGRKAAA